MSILVRLPEPLRGGAGESMTIDSDVRTMGELIHILEQRIPDFAQENDELYNFAVNGEMILHGEKDVPLKKGDEVEVLVALSGG